MVAASTPECAIMNDHHTSPRHIRLPRIWRILILMGVGFGIGWAAMIVMMPQP